MIRNIIKSSTISRPAILLIVLSAFFLFIYISPSKTRTGKAINPLSWEIPTPTTPVISDNRVLLSFNNLSDYNKWTKENCQEDFNISPPNIWVQYSNSEIGIKFKVPFNSNWGSSRFRIKYYDEYQGYVFFGPFIVQEACTWSRSYYLEPIPHLSITEVLNKIKNDPDSQLIGTKFNINGLDIIKYVQSNGAVGGCDSPTFQISGKKFNYLLSTQCSQNLEEDFTWLEEVLKTFVITK